MATGDKLVTLDGLKVVYDKVDGDVGGLKSTVSETNDVLSLDGSVSLSFTTTDSGYGIRFSTGELTSNSSLEHTDYIDVSKYSKLTYKRVASTQSSPIYGMAFYDTNKVYISGQRSVANVSAFGYEISDIDVPENAAYARFSTIKDTETHGNFALSGKSIIYAKVENIDKEIAENNAILGFKDNISLSFGISNTGNAVVFNTGDLTASTPYSATDYVDVSKYIKLYYRQIKVTASTTLGMAFYNSNKQFLSGVRGATGQESAGYMDGLATVDVPENAVYARFTTRSDTVTYGEFALNGKSKVLYAAKKYASEFRKNVIFGKCSSDWYKAHGDTYNAFTIDTLYSEMISAWDSLAENSNGYITREEIGTASDGQTMYCYKLIPTRYRNNTGTSITNNAPVFLIVPSLHGFEKSAAYGTYYFARDLVYNFTKNAVLNSLRTKCILYVVPVGNPWGFDNKQRKNANGVDLNRNWGVDTSGEGPDSAYYPGAEPFDQPETQAIKAIIDNTDTLFYVVDYHTNGQYRVSSWADVNWLPCPAQYLDDEYASNVYVASQFHVSEITENLMAEYSLDTEDETIGSITTGLAVEPRKTISYYARNERHILGSTFEGNNGLPSEESAYSATEQKINSELIGNWIKNLYLAYSDI